MVVDIHDDFVDSFGFTNIGSVINLYVDEPGATAARGGYASGNVFFNVPRVFGNADLPEGTTSVLALDNNALDSTVATAEVGNRGAVLLTLGSGNIEIDDPAFVDSAAGDFRLRGDSPARGGGSLGQEAGAFVSAGMFMQGEPHWITDATNAILTVGGPGFFSFQFRVKDGEWSEELPIGETIGFDRNAL